MNPDQVYRAAYGAQLQTIATLQRLAEKLIAKNERDRLQAERRTLRLIWRKKQRGPIYFVPGRGWGGKEPLRQRKRWNTAQGAHDHNMRTLAGYGEGFRAMERRARLARLLRPVEKPPVVTWDPGFF